MSEDSGAQQGSSTSRGLNLEALKTHIIAHKIDCALWAIRVLTIVFTTAYFIPLFWSSQSMYNKALLANAATSALRLHQRLGTIQFNQRFLAELLLEDSCHYLFYSLIFLLVSPTSFALLPVVLFAILHSSSYSLTLLDTLGQNSWWGARLLISLVEFQSLNILRLIAVTEIFLMPLTIFLLFFGAASLMTPFIYYRFLVQRYTSRRNPYTRNMFHELKVMSERTANSPKSPAILKSVIMACVNFVGRLAPQQIVQPPAQ